MAHIHSIYDTDPHFIIDPVTRRIKNDSGKVVLVQGDHNSERFMFEIPRYVDGHDMSLCDVVETHYNNVGSSAEETYSDVEEIGDLQVSPASNDVVIFSWLISGNATQYKGALNFAISFQCHDAEGNIDYELGTLTHEGITIGERIRNSKSVIERVADILSTWRANLFGIGKTEEAKMRAVSQEEQAAIVAKGADVLATIPADYAATSAMAEEAIRTKADGIVLSAEGEAIVVNDSSDDYIRGLRVFGKSVQEGDPTPDNPQEIVYVENPTASVYGKNLLNVEPNLTFTQYLGMDVNIPAGEYVLRCENLSHEYDYGPNIKFSSNNVWVEFKDSVLSKKVTLTKAETKLHFYADSADYNWSAGKTATINGLMLSAIDAPYEPYIIPQLISINRTLHGIPVTSGGNYTDENGQQWICDEVDFARGVYVQRVGSVVYDGSEDEKWYAYGDAEYAQTRSFSNWSLLDAQLGFGMSICDRFQRLDGCWGGQHDGQHGVYSDHTTACAKFFRPPNGSIADVQSWNKWLSEHNTHLFYALATPIETHLSESELAAFRALKTNKLTTTVLNDSGAHMQLDYIADTKAYIDNQITKRIAEITNI